jgi:hypothetical protein
MSTVRAKRSRKPPPPRYSIPPECIPDVTDIVIDDGAPVDGLINYEGMAGTWLRWCDRDKHVIPTGAERSEMERALSQRERKRTRKAVQEIKRLRQKLRDSGIEPK